MNHLPIETTQNLTMTSREIAELTGKEHKNVVRDVRAMFEDLEKDRLKTEPVSGGASKTEATSLDQLKTEPTSSSTSSFERTYLDAANREQPEYVLNFEDTLTLLTGYSVVLRRKVIARWRELEAAPKTVAVKALPSFNFAEKLAAQEAEIVEEIAKKQAAWQALGMPKYMALKHAKATLAEARVLGKRMLRKEQKLFNLANEAALREEHREQRRALKMAQIAAVSQSRGITL